MKSFVMKKKKTEIVRVDEKATPNSVLSIRNPLEVKQHIEMNVGGQRKNMTC